MITEEQRLIILKALRDSYANLTAKEMTEKEFDNLTNAMTIVKNCSIPDVSGSFFRLNEWFDSNANSFGELNGQKLYEEKEAKRLCLKLVKEVIESVRKNEFHFKNMSDLEVIEYLLK